MTRVMASENQGKCTKGSHLFQFFLHFLLFILTATERRVFCFLWLIQNPLVPWHVSIGFYFSLLLFFVLQYTFYILYHWCPWMSTLYIASKLISGIVRCFLLIKLCRLVLFESVSWVWNPIYIINILSFKFELNWGNLEQPHVLHL